MALLEPAERNAGLSGRPDQDFKVQFVLMVRRPLLWVLICLSLAGLLAWLAPFERSLGANARLVYFHGAWVWVATLAYAAAALAGLAGLLTRRMALHQWSQALGRTGLCFWISFLPMSLLVMQANWNGLYLSEPRFRIPLNLAIVGLLLQLGLSFLPQIAWTSLGNIVYAGMLFFGMRDIQSVLHPESPILNSNARDIQLFFLGLLVLLLLTSWQMARAWQAWQLRPPKVAG
jgi:hypothetical protein